MGTCRELSDSYSITPLISQSSQPTSCHTVRSSPHPSAALSVRCKLRSTFNILLSDSPDVHLWHHCKNDNEPIGGTSAVWNGIAPYFKLKKAGFQSQLYPELLQRKLTSQEWILLFHLWNKGCMPAEQKLFTSFLWVSYKCIYSLLNKVYIHMSVPEVTRCKQENAAN